MLVKKAQKYEKNVFIVIFLEIKTSAEQKSLCKHQFSLK